MASLVSNCSRYYACSMTDGLFGYVGVEFSQSSFVISPEAISDFRLLLNAHVHQTDEKYAKNQMSSWRAPENSLFIFTNNCPPTTAVFVSDVSVRPREVMKIVAQKWYELSEEEKKVE